MKFSSVLASAAAALSATSSLSSPWTSFSINNNCFAMAWSPNKRVLSPSTLSNRITPSSTRQNAFYTTTTATTTSLLHATLAPSDNDETTITTATPIALTPTGKTVAQGKIVSAFKGGLVAVKLRDEDASIGKKVEPTIVDTTTQKNESGSTNKKSQATALGGGLIGHQAVLPNGNVGVVVAHRPPVVFIQCGHAETETDNNNDDDDDNNNMVHILDNSAAVSLTNQVCQLDAFGRILKSKTENDDSSNVISMQRAIFAPIPQVKDIALINSPMVTGVTMFDALAPIGNGQNMLLVGHDIQDMRGYVTDMLKSQQQQKQNYNKKTKCIYAATHYDKQEEITQMLSNAGVLDDVVLVVPPSNSNNDGTKVDASSQAAQATLVAATACAVGEAFALQQHEQDEEGTNTLVIIDTLDYHKQLWDATTRVLVDVYGVEAVVKSDREGGASSEMRAFFSSLIQRSGQFKKRLGGGSVTLLLMTTIPPMMNDNDNDDSTIFTLDDFQQSSDKIKERLQLLVKKNIPLTASTLRKIQIPVPTASEGQCRLVLQHVDDLISMSDGQIWFDERLQKQMNRYPPMDPQRSITRIGIGADTKSRADAPAMRKVVEGLRLDLAQAASMDGADFGTNASQRQLRKSKALLLAMHQEPGSGGRTLAESCTVLLAASRGYLDSSIMDMGDKIQAGSAHGEELISNLMAHVSNVAPGAMETINSTNDMDDETLAEIETAIQAFFK